MKLVKHLDTENMIFIVVQENVILEYFLTCKKKLKEDIMNLSGISGIGKLFKESWYGL